MYFIKIVLRVSPEDPVGALEEDPEYQLIVTSNALMADIDDDIAAIHKYVIDLYSKKFPGLEGSITDMMDYFRVVKLIANEMVRFASPLLCCISWMLTPPLCCPHLTGYDQSSSVRCPAALFSHGRDGDGLIFTVRAAVR